MEKGQEESSDVEGGATKRCKNERLSKQLVVVATTTSSIATKPLANNRICCSKSVYRRCLKSSI